MTIQQNASSLETLLAKLVSFKTLPHDHTSNQHALDWITKQLKDLPLHLQTISINGFPSLLITTRKTKKPRIWLQAHLDIVPGSEDAFQMRIEDNKLIGRGTFDMKYAIASYIKLAQELGAELSNYDFGIMITTDEEIGGRNGVGALLNQGYSAEAAFLPDGGKNWQFVSASRGIWHLQAQYIGESNHGSRPWLGKNAITGLMHFIEDVLALFLPEPCSITNHFHSSINVGVFKGGIATNQIPQQAEVNFDIRYVMEDYSTIKSNIDGLLQKYPEVSLRTIAEGSGYTVDQNNSHFSAYADILQEHGIAIGFEITHGSSDARYFTQHNIPAIVLRPAGGGHHSENEWLDRKGFALFQNVDPIRKTANETLASQEKQN